MEQLGKDGVRLVCQRIQVDDSPEGRLLENQMPNFAEFKREKIRLRTMLGRRRKEEVGKVVGLGAPPFDYRFTYETIEHQQKVFGLELDPATAPIALRIVRAVRYRSTVDVADKLNRDGIPSSTGKRWANKVIQRMATNPVDVGTWIHGRFDQRCTPEDHNGVAVEVPALFSRDEWEANQRALSHRRLARRGQIPRDEDPYVLRGLLTCGHCQGALQSQPNRGTRYYQCARHIPSLARRYGKPRCDLPDMYAVDLEAELWRLLSVTLLDEDYLAVGLEAARSKPDKADQLRKERLDAQDAQIARQR
jgi:site-specific DNA recombinase